MVVDRGSPAARGDHRADARRHYLITRGQSAGGDADRARTLSLLQSSRAVSAALLHRADRRVVPVAAPAPPHRADRVRGLARAVRGETVDRAGGHGLTD